MMAIVLGVLFHFHLGHIISFIFRSLHINWFLFLLSVHAFAFWLSKGWEIIIVQNPLVSFVRLRMFFVIFNTDL